MELYDLEADLSESRNLAASRSEIVEDLHATYRGWRDELEAAHPAAQVAIDPVDFTATGRGRRLRGPGSTVVRRTLPGRGSEHVVRQESSEERTRSSPENRGAERAGRRSRFAHTCPVRPTPWSPQPSSSIGPARHRRFQASLHLRQSVAVRDHVAASRKHSERGMREVGIVAVRGRSGGRCGGAGMWGAGAS